MKIVKFKKTHVSGIEKGAIKKMDESTALRLEKAGYVEESTEALYDAYVIKQSNIKIESKYEAVKEEVNATKSECLDCNGECEECKEKEALLISEKTYHILTEEDIDANQIAAEGFEVGDEVEINASDELLLNNEGKLIGKELGNV